METKQLFEMALQICEPWFIEKLDYRPTTPGKIGQLDIFINFKKGAVFKDSKGPDCKAYDTENKVWQLMNFFECKSFIHARIPRTESKTDGIKTVPVPWARPGSGFTLMFEAFSMLLIEKEMPINSVASILRVTAPRIWRMFKYWVTRAINNDDLSNVEKVGIDETSKKKGHNYITIGVDFDSNRVIHVCPGKGASTVGSIADSLDKKGGDSSLVSDIGIDMSPAFISGAMKYFPNASITFDKFHVNKMINEAIDTVRKQERKLHLGLKGAKYIFLKGANKLSARERDLKYELLQTYPALADAHRLKELFMDFWEYDNEEEASSFLAYWCDLAGESGVSAFQKVANMVKSHWSGIVNYTKSKITNGVLEGINSKIQLAKKRARGYRNTENFICMIYFIAGKLKFDYPHYPL